jgi:hypothetical protein
MAIDLKLVDCGGGKGGGGADWGGSSVAYCSQKCKEVPKLALGLLCCSAISAVQMPGELPQKG